MDRYRVYCVLDDLFNNLEFLNNPESKYAEIPSNEDKEFLIEVAKEMFDNNIDSFTNDW